VDAGAVAVVDGTEVDVAGALVLVGTDTVG
jgi:hypothetical protein